MIKPAATLWVHFSAFATKDTLCQVMERHVQTSTNVPWACITANKDALIRLDNSGAHVLLDIN